MDQDGPNAARSLGSLGVLSLNKSLIWELEGTTICRSGKLADQKHAGENLEQEVPRGPMQYANQE